MTTSADLRIDFAEARAALAAIAPRTGQLFGSITDGNQAVRRSTWRVGEVGAHLAVALAGFTDAVAGNFAVVEPHIRPGSFAERLAGVNAGTLDVEAERNPQALAGMIADRVDRFLAATKDLSGDERVSTPWYGETASMSVATATVMLLGEQLLHGWDVATTLRRPWPISLPEANLVIRAVTTMMPLVANPETAGGLRATYGITVSEGGPRFVVDVDHGVVTVGPAGESAVDCHISTDPVTFVLVGYGRVSQWGPIAKFQLRAWGRKPWLAFRFVNLFFNP